MPCFDPVRQTPLFLAGVTGRNPVTISGHALPSIARAHPSAWRRRHLACQWDDGNGCTGNGVCLPALRGTALWLMTPTESVFLTTVASHGNNRFERTSSRRTSFGWQNQGSGAASTTRSGNLSTFSNRSHPPGRTGRETAGVHGATLRGWVGAVECRVHHAPLRSPSFRTSPYCRSCRMTAKAWARSIWLISRF